MNVTVDDVIEAYENTGLTPVIDIYHDAELNVACLLGVLAINDGADRSTRSIYQWVMDKPLHYTVGLEVGFTGKCTLPGERPDEYMRGYEVGLEANNIINPTISEEVKQYA